MNDLGLLRYVRGQEVAYSPRGYLLSQHKYVTEIVSQACLMDDSKRVDTPIELNIKLRATYGELLHDPTFYRQLKCKKQKRIALSTTEAEYRAMTQTTTGIIWLRWLLAGSIKKVGTRKWNFISKLLRIKLCPKYKTFVLLSSHSVAQPDPSIRIQPLSSNHNHLCYQEPRVQEDGGGSKEQRWQEVDVVVAYAILHNYIMMTQGVDSNRELHFRKRVERRVVVEGDNFLLLTQGQAHDDGVSLPNAMTTQLWGPTQIARSFLAHFLC
ncbi:uncharacterized protein LOC105420783 [Amborella trichopoda]|uniref:uncharacterized protein LOC105420783 n=1 Tax=Amborella trichopoda TaxID=13333 RepID=UPI0005D42A72|nr:uncharacterized protein LOC105420783 [Amborella trichopoda]|eukprot:XP_011624159.1 uncharacterized protein LOC105420783 [Amborella trichopoda]